MSNDGRVKFFMKVDGTLFDSRNIKDGYVPDVTEEASAVLMLLLL